MSGFNANLFGPFEPGRSRMVKIEISETGFLFVVPGGTQFVLPAAAARLSLGGFDGKAVIVDGKPVDGPQLHAVVIDPAFPGALATLGPVSLRLALRPPPDQWFWEDFSFSFDWAAKHKAVSIPAALLCAWLVFTAVVEIVVAFMPVRWETTLGQFAVQSLIHEERVLKDGPAVEIVDGVWKRVQKGIPANPYTWQIFVVDSPTVNALAAPGGQIVVFTGLLQTMKTPEELAGILGHEVTHALRRHGIRGMVRSALLALIVTMTVGDGGALTGIVRDFGQEIAVRSFSRSQEREADRGAVEIMTRASIDPGGFSVFLARLAAKEGQFGAMLGLLSTHPPSSERVEFLKDLSGKLNSSGFQPIGISLQALSASETTALKPGGKRLPAEQPPTPQKPPKRPFNAGHPAETPGKKALPANPGSQNKPGKTAGNSSSPSAAPPSRNR